MLALLNTLVAQILVLTLLLVLLFGPLVAIWIAFSIRRSLARIADSLDGARLTTHDPVESRTGDPFDSPVVRERNIANSLFGR